MRKLLSDCYQPFLRPSSRSTEGLAAVCDARIIIVTVRPAVILEKRSLTSALLLVAIVGKRRSPFFFSEFTRWDLFTVSRRCEQTKLTTVCITVFRQAESNSTFNWCFILSRGWNSISGGYPFVDLTHGTLDSDSQISWPIVVGFGSLTVENRYLCELSLVPSRIERMLRISCEICSMNWTLPPG